MAASSSSSSSSSTIPPITKDITTLSSLISQLIHSKVDPSKCDQFGIIISDDGTTSKFKIDNGGGEIKAGNTLIATFGEVIASDPELKVVKPFCYPALKWPNILTDAEMLEPDKTSELYITVPRASEGRTKSTPIQRLNLGIQSMRSDYHTQLRSISAEIIGEPGAAYVGLGFHTTIFKRGAPRTFDEKFSKFPPDLSSYEGTGGASLKGPSISLYGVPSRNDLSEKLTVPESRAAEQAVDVLGTVANDNKEVEIWTNPKYYRCNPMAKRMASWNTHALPIYIRDYANALGAASKFIRLTPEEEISLRDTFGNANIMVSDIPFNTIRSSPNMPEVIMFKSPFMVKDDISSISKNADKDFDVNIVRWAAFCINKWDQMRVVYKLYYDLLRSLTPVAAKEFYDSAKINGLVLPNVAFENWAPTPFVCPFSNGRPNNDAPVYFIYITQIFDWVDRLVAETYGSEQQYNNVETLWVTTTRGGPKDGELLLKLKIVHAQIKDHVEFMGPPLRARYELVYQQRPLASIRK